MSYHHIPNLYRPEGQSILLFRECYALEKIDGTSAHISWREGSLTLSPGAAPEAQFRAFFQGNPLEELVASLGHYTLTIFGEAYGGSLQGLSGRYGQAVRFVAFDVQVGGQWWTVPEAHGLCKKLGIEFVHYARVPTDLDALDKERDAESEQSKRNGLGGGHPREGVVLRPLLESIVAGDRVIAKHKRDEERETRTPRPVVDPEKLQVLTEAKAVALEWVTDRRLAHVLQKLPQGIGVRDTKKVIEAVQEDVLREGKGEFVESKEVLQALGKRAAELFHSRFKKGF
jgi:hypothetical protein